MRTSDLNAALDQMVIATDARAGERMIEAVCTFLADAAIGIAAGALVLAAVRGVQRLLRPRTA